MPSPEEWPSRQQWRTKFGLQVRLLTISRPYLTIVIPTNGRDMLLLEGKSGGKSGTAVVPNLPPSASLVDSKGRAVSTASLSFHELAEAFAKIDGSLPYSNFQPVEVMNGTTLVVGPPQMQTGAHEQAVQREYKLRDQRPSVRETGRAGDQLHQQVIRDPHN